MKLAHYLASNPTHKYWYSKIYGYKYFDDMWKVVTNLEIPSELKSWYCGGSGLFGNRQDMTEGWVNSSQIYIVKYWRIFANILGDF
jgi:hypothetical protein